MWRAFPFDTPDLILRLELTSHTIQSSIFDGVFKKWKVRYNLHEYKGALSMAVAAQAVLGTNRFNDERSLDNAKTASLFSSMSTRTQHRITRKDHGVMEEVRRKLHQTRVMVSFKQNSDSMPCFDIMHSGVSVKFPPEQKKDIASGAVVARYFPVTVYRIPIYRQPFHVIRTMVAPLLICDFGTILVFRMRVLPPPHSNYNDRISTLVTVLLALFAFLTYARSALPDVPVSTWMDTVIFQSIVMTCLGMIETFIAYETAHVLKQPQSSDANATSAAEEVTDESRRRLVSKSGGSSTSQYTFDSDYEVFWPRGGEHEWLGTDAAIWCHTTLRFLVFAVVIMLWVSMAMKLYWRLYCFRLMVQVNDDLLSTQSNEVKRKATDFDPSAYDWPESTEFITSVAANISRANDEEGGIIEGIEHLITRPSNTGRHSFKTNPEPVLEGGAQSATNERHQPKPPLKRGRSAGPGMLADPNEFSSPSVIMPRVGGQGKFASQPFTRPIKGGGDELKAGDIRDAFVGLAATTEER